jgi:hypothetical protein
MEEFLRTLNGKQVDISFGGSAAVRGKIVGLKEGVLSMDDEEGRSIYVETDKITSVC